MRTLQLSLALSFSMFALVISPATAHADSTDFNVDTKASTITYHLVHKLHKFDGVSKNVQGRARILPSGQAQVMVRSSVESFDSGNVNRDAHMKETVEAARYPSVEIKAASDGITLPTTFPATIEKTWKAQLTFHGVTQTFDLPVKIVVESDKKARATANIKVSLEAYKIERPELMFKKVDDDMSVDINVVFAR